MKIALPEFKLPEIPPPVEDGKIDESGDKEKEDRASSVSKTGLLYVWQIDMHSTNIIVDTYAFEIGPSRSAVKLISI